jgi:hypothetical protein
MISRCITTNENQPLTAVWQKWQCGASYDSFVDNQTVVLRLKFGAKNRHLRQAANRWHSLTKRNQNLMK